MLEIYLPAIIVSVAKRGQIATVVPGTGALAFGAMVAWLLYQELKSSGHEIQITFEDLSGLKAGGIDFATLEESGGKVRDEY